MKLIISDSHVIKTALFMQSFVRHKRGYLDSEQSLFSLLSSSSRGKTSRIPARGNLGEEKQAIFHASLVFPRVGFRAPEFAMSFRGSTNSRRKIGTARSLGYFKIIFIYKKNLFSRNHSQN